MYLQSFASRAHGAFRLAPIMDFLGTCARLMQSLLVAASMLFWVPEDTESSITSLVCEIVLRASHQLGCQSFRSARMF